MVLPLAYRKSQGFLNDTVFQKNPGNLRDVLFRQCFLQGNGGRGNEYRLSFSMKQAVDDRRHEIGMGFPCPHFSLT